MYRFSLQDFLDVFEKTDRGFSREKRRYFVLTKKAEQQRKLEGVPLTFHEKKLTYHPLKIKIKSL